MHRTTFRPAIVMIELIFALVIMGIVLMSAPRLVFVASQSGYVAIQQEAINEAASHVNMIMGYHWDENDTDERFLDPILQTDSTITDLKEFNNTGRRPGTPLESYRAFVRADGVRLSASSFTSFGPSGDASDTFKDDIDDFSGDTVHLVLVPEVTLVTDNVETTTIDINTTIDYSLDGTGAAHTGGYNSSDITYNPFTSTTGSASSSIKSITVTLTSSSSLSEVNEKEIVLHAFSCNIGGYNLEERDF